jgi:RNA polymerase sigma-70 factor (ECF subfamily)
MIPTTTTTTNAVPCAGEKLGFQRGTPDAGCRPDSSDADLLASVLGRSQQAWVEFVRRYRGLIYRCIGKVTAKYAALLDREAIEDIFGDVCLNLLRDDMHKLRAYRDDRGSKLGSWIGLIAINTAYDYLRCLARQPRLEQIDLACELGGGVDLSIHTQSPLDLLAEQERWERLNRLARRFSSRDRRFLELYYGDGLEPEEIAEQMGISVKTVYSKKNKVLARLTRMAAVDEAAGAPRRRRRSEARPARGAAGRPAARNSARRGPKVAALEPAALRGRSRRQAAVPTDSPLAAAA